MEISGIKEDSKLTIALTGKLDTVTAPDLDKEIDENIDGVTELVIDFSQLEYISSAGLRALLKAKKIMLNQGSMVVTGCNETVLEIFEVTGFKNVLDIQ